MLAGPGLEQTKLLAGREKDLEDARELLARRKDIDHRLVIELLESALERSDLVALYRRLRR